MGSKRKVKITTSKDTTTNVKIKKVTETWSISEQKAGGSKRKDRKRAREPNLSEDSGEEEGNESNHRPVVQESSASRKGKSSSKRPPKNKAPPASSSVMREQPMEVQVPKRYSERAKKVFYAEYEDEF